MSRRVLWIGDGGCNTGFGVVTHNIGERLVRDFGHEVHVLATNHRGDSWPSILEPERETYLRLYRPTMYDQKDVYGLSRVIELLDKVRPDVVVMLNDPKLILDILFRNSHDRLIDDAGQEQRNILLRHRPILTYVPCDGTNLPPEWTEVVPRVTTMLAMSKWGQQAYSTPERPVDLVYHGVDTDTFHPVSKDHPIILEGSGEVLTSKRDCKRVFKFDPEGFLVLRVDANSGRKDYAASYKALVPFMERHSDVQVHFHGQATNSQSGVNLAALWSRTPQFKPGVRWFVPGLLEGTPGWPISHLAALYNAADVFLSTSRGEGFGLTIAEAAACGVPVVAQNVSAIPEVVGPGGLLVDPLDRLITVPSGEDTWLADIAGFTAALERIYQSKGLRRDLGAAGCEHVRRTFRWDEAAAKFDTYIERLANGQFGAVEPAPAGA